MKSKYLKNEMSCIGGCQQHMNDVVPHEEGKRGKGSREKGTHGEREDYGTPKY